MIPDAAHGFARRCESALGESLRAVILIGSFARGDETPTSDVDLVVLVESVHRGLLRAVSEIVASLPSENELNPAVIAASELAAEPDIFGWLNVKHDGVLLAGAFPEEPAGSMSELRLARRIAGEVLLSSRHYLSVGEPAEKFAGGKLWTWNQKPLGFALRFY